ncbi:hypothetical protein NDU88_002571 [Pleurodeles waltl]|uniref:Uncharacterized protein n=1 Tax=Pleurodeles waltl TaxID=8319 RepID=A0AAV7T2Q8_PLEWA|nr:hypothetical protein NDU88_002571 [Pleurodeles waltl]
MRALVLVRNRHAGEKFCLPFEAVPWTVGQVKGTLITAQKGNDSITRNVPFFKWYRSLESPPREDGGDSTHICVTPREVGTPVPSPNGSTTLSPAVGQDEVPNQGTLDESQSGGRDDEAGCQSGSVTSNENAVVQTHGTTRYHLTPKPQVSTRLKDFVVT